MTTPPPALPPPRPLTLATADGPLAAVLFAPAAGADDVGGVRAWLLLPPLAEERKGAARPLGELGRALAGTGRTALFVDYFGTGESPGDFSAATWPRWLANCAAALDFLRRRSGAERVGIVAARAAARLALELAGGHAEAVERLVFWEPVVDTAAWLRDLRRRSVFRLGSARAALDDKDLDGYAFGDVLWDELSRTSAPPSPPPGAAATVFTLAPDGRAGAGMLRLAAALGATCVGVDQPPFWLESDPARGGPLLDYTLAAIGVCT